MGETIFARCCECGRPLTTREIDSYVSTFPARYMRCHGCASESEPETAGGADRDEGGEGG